VTLPLRVTVAPERADAAPGDNIQFDVTVRNASDIVEHYGVELLGLPEGATVRTEPDVAKLRPAESGTLTVRVGLPVQPPAPAGTYVLGALVRSKYRHDVSRCVEVPVELASVEQITVSSTPEVVIGGRSGQFTVEVANGGNAPVRLYLAATDPERRVTVQFQPPTVDLPPGGRARSLLSVEAPLPWNREKQHGLTITAHPDLAGAVPATSTASFVQKPRLASKFAKIAGISAAVVLVAAAIAVPALLAQTKDKPPADPAAANQPQVVLPPSAAGQPPAAQPSAAAPPGPPAPPAPPPGLSRRAAAGRCPVGGRAARGVGRAAGPGRSAGGRPDLAAARRGGQRRVPQPGLPGRRRPRRRGRARLRERAQRRGLRDRRGQIPHLELRRRPGPVQRGAAADLVPAGHAARRGHRHPGPARLARAGRGVPRPDPAELRRPGRPGRAVAGARRAEQRAAAAGRGRYAGCRDEAVDRAAGLSPTFDRVHRTDSSRMPRAMMTRQVPPLMNDPTTSVGWCMPR
jgi:hypothetical protein